MPGLPARIAVLLLLVLFQTACAPSSNKAMYDALKTFTGSWKVISLDRGGEKSDADALKDMTVTMEGDKFMFVEMAGPGASTDQVKARDVRSEDYIFQVNPANSGEIDFVYATGENRGKSRPGLYQFEGKVLKICLASAGNSRPMQIAPGDDLTVFVLERKP